MNTALHALLIGRDSLPVACSLHHLQQSEALKDFHLLKLMASSHLNSL